MRPKIEGAVLPMSETTPVDEPENWEEVFMPLLGIARFEDMHGDKETAAILVRAFDRASEMLEQLKFLAEERDTLQDLAVLREADGTGHMRRCAKVNGRWSCTKGCLFPMIQEQDDLNDLYPDE